MTEKERYAAWTKTALAHKDGQGRPIEKEEVIFKSVAEKDSYGQVIIGDTVGSREEQEKWRKERLRKGRPISPFAEEKVVNAFTDF